ncbi:hypothetical protein M446_6910 [Methylobacterium sp. 4-46]|nr:hypothetical protein M446_6910 [Methylobacterium sp. 4-46]
MGGADSTNLIYGDSSYNSGTQCGNDTVAGGVGGVNFLYGDSRTAVTGSRAGDDRLISAANTIDEMWGDWQYSDGTAIQGHNVFVFGPNNGNDIIHDFHPGEDKIEFDGLYVDKVPEKALARIPVQAAAHLPTRLAMLSELSIEVSGGNSIIHVDANNSITVEGVISLSASDFKFIA